MKLSNQYIFILGTTKFDNPYESASYIIAKELALTNHVFYIENPFTWKDYFKYKGSAEFNLRKNLFSGASEGIISTNIPNLKIVITPPLLSINFLPEGKLYRFLLKINESIIVKRIKKVLRSYKIENYIYINSFNFHYPDIADSLKPLLQVYHCVDPLIMPFDRKHGLVSELNLLNKSQVVICTSKQLYEEKKSLNKNTYFIPNAADISHSSKALDDNLAIHESVAQLQKPVIGYFGNIERRMDFDLIKS
ncbi:MAG: glycosyltransferase family 1 protein, partial [Pyrinomonadaceae bacterium]|nr:glycosyltransferase family 1 protein [Sphingobacteriaceae bacterium]